MNWPMIVAFGGWLICAWAFPLGFYMGSKSKEIEIKTKALRLVHAMHVSELRTSYDEPPDEVVMN